jgi:hypothetical protein
MICGCPDSCVTTNEKTHREFHALVEQQTGIGYGHELSARTLRAAQGWTTPAPDMHSIAARNERQGKSAPGWRRRAAA